MVKVFSYGSNLCIERLHARTPSARVAMVGTLAGHSLRWHKKARDGSGKCNAFATGEDRDAVWGVVYELTPDDKRALDKCEGLGEHYFEKMVCVRTADGVELQAIAYVANPKLLDDTLRPYGWYKSFVTTGALQHGLMKMVPTANAGLIAEGPGRWKDVTPFPFTSGVRKFPLQRV